MLAALKTLIKNWYRIVIIVVALVSLSNNVALADGYSSGDVNSIVNGTPFYDPTQQSSCPTNSSTPQTGSQSGSWSSGLSGPYYLEEFAIQVLEDVAHKLNKPQTDVVNEAHVDALIAWFWVEGGDIQDGPPSGNPDPNLFNLLNTSISDPSLETTNGGGGLESFSSFDAGVEGTARTIVGSFQSRIGLALTTSTTSANDVVTAIADYQNYPGNLAWAFGPSPNNPSAVQQFNQTVYLPSLLSSVSQLQKNYVGEASTIIGTPKAEALLNLRVSPSLLQYSGGGVGSPSNTTGASKCASTITTCNSPPTPTGATPTSSNSTAGLSTVRQNVVCIAQQEYQKWKTGQLLPATGFLTYTQNNYQLWCADFVSWVYDQAKYPLQPDPNWRIPAVVGIQSIGEQNQNFHWHSLSTDRGYVPKPGDIAIISNQHTELVISVTGNTWIQIGGDEGNVQYYGTKNPPSQSYVDQYTVTGFNGEGVTGYVSPD